MKVITLNRVVILIALFLLAIDRLGKTFAWNFLTDSHIEVTNFFRLALSVNRQIAFSLPINGAWALTLIAIALIILFKYFLYFKKINRPTASLLILILIISALSNLYDRLLYGGVIDYLEITNFSSFNLADVLISVSVGLLILILIKRKES
jgi:signal peptidase II